MPSVMYGTSIEMPSVESVTIFSSVALSVLYAVEVVICDMAYTPVVEPAVGCCLRLKVTR
jgi:hypothetical protein